jgi:hypothetical protein
MLFFLYFVGDAANFGVEVDGEVVEQYLDWLAFLIAQFSLIVDLQAPSIEAQHFFDLFAEVVFEEIFHIFFQGLHEIDVL